MPQVMVSGHVGRTGEAGGEGFKSERTETGSYVIHFDTVFKQPPAVVVTLTAGSATSVGRDNTTTVRPGKDSAMVWVYDLQPDGEAVLSDFSFNFIAVGEI